MIKIRNKRIAMLLVLTMLATMFVGVGAASAAGNITALTTPTISDSDNQTLGKIKVTVPAGVIASGDAIVVNLPDDYEFSSAVVGTVGTGDNGTVNEVYVPTNISTSDLNSLKAADLIVSGGNAGSDNFTITAIGNQASTNDGVFYIALDDIDASSASSGEAVVTFDGSTNTGFPRGTVIVGTLASDGEVTLSAKSTQTRNDDFTFTLRIRESLAGSFVDKSKSIKLKLPSGYEWDTNNTTLTPDTVWGDNNVAIDVAINNAGDTITLTPTPAESTEASCWEIPLKFYVDDEDDVEAGAIEATISGSSSLSPSKLKVGTYGDYDATVKAGETVPTLLAGFEEQEIADIIVKESMKESLQANRTITLTLPAGARWQEAIDGSKTPATFDSDSSLSLNSTGFTGTDDRTAKYTVNTQSTSDAEITLENAEVAIEPGFTGDLVVTVAGNAGVKGEIIVAKVVTPVTVAVSAKTDVEIGQAGQAVGDITITEAEAGAIKDGKLTLRLPEGFKWTNRGTVSVEAGNVKIDSTTTKGDNDRNLVIDVTSDSTTASEIKLTGATITVNRTVAEGEFKVFVLGSAVLDPLKDAKGDAIWPNSTTAANAVLGTIITAAGGNIANTGIFTIGSTTYTINGVEKTMDVAPYISDSRTYMPIRYVAYTMGIDDNNILWDGDQRTVTLIKGDKVVQMAIGSKTLLINGAAVTMDVAPVITSDRTMLPIAFVAQAFGSVATWDATTQTVTIK